MNLHDKQSYSRIIQASLGDFDRDVDVLDPLLIDFVLTETEELLHNDIVVPTIPVLRIILTLSSRVPATYSQLEGNGITRMLQQTLHQPHQAAFFPTASNNQRAALILLRACDVMCSSYRQNHRVFNALYSKFMAVMAEFAPTQFSVNDFDFVSDSEDESILSAIAKGRRDTKIVLSPSKRPRKNNQDSDKSATGNVQVFSEPLISAVICPSLSRPYNIWSLMEWTFFCCFRSSENSAKSSCYGELYRNYNTLLMIIWRLVTINFVSVLDLLMNDGAIEHFEIMHLFFYSSESKQSEIISRLQDPSLFVLRALMVQISGDKEEWYKRIADIVLRGPFELDDPPSPYISDRLFIKNAEKLVHMDSSLTDNIKDSMRLRVDVLSLVYYNALFFDKGDAFLNAKDVEPQDYDLVPKILVQKIAVKLEKFPYDRMRQFFEVSLTSESSGELQVPANHRKRMMMEIARELVEILTGRGSVELDIRPGESQLPWELQFAQEMVSIVEQKTIYRMIIRENEGSSAGLKDSWCKVCYLFGWLLDMTFCELQADSGNAQYLLQLRDGVERADATNAQAWREATGTNELPFVKYVDIFTSRFLID